MVGEGERRKGCRTKVRGWNIPEEGMACAHDTRDPGKWAKFEEGGEQAGNRADPPAECRCRHFCVILGVRFGVSVFSYETISYGRSEVETALNCSGPRIKSRCPVVLDNSWSPLCHVTFPRSLRSFAPLDACLLPAS